MSAWNRRVQEAGFSDCVMWTEKEADEAKDAMMVAKRCALEFMKALKASGHLSEAMTEAFENVELHKSWHWNLFRLGRAREDLKRFQGWQQTVPRPSLSILLVLGSCFSMFFLFVEFADVRSTLQLMQVSCSKEKLRGAFAFANLLSGVQHGCLRGVPQQQLRRLEALLEYSKSTWWSRWWNPVIMQGIRNSLSQDQWFALTQQERANFLSSQQRTDEQNQQYNRRYAFRMKVFAWICIIVTLVLAIVTWGASLAATAVFFFICACVALVASAVGAAVQWRLDQIEHDTSIDRQTREREKHILSIISSVAGAVALVAGMLQNLAGSVAKKIAQQIRKKLGKLLDALLKVLQLVQMVKGIGDAVERMRRVLGFAPADDNTFGAAGDGLSQAAAKLEAISAIKALASAVKSFIQKNQKKKEAGAGSGWVCVYTHNCFELSVCVCV